MANIKELISDMQNDLEGVLHVDASEIKAFTGNLMALKNSNAPVTGAALSKLLLPMVNQLQLHNEEISKGNSGGGGGGLAMSQNEILKEVFNSKGDINIVITRLTNNVTLNGGAASSTNPVIALPFVLFGQNDSQSGYFNFLKTVKSNLPANVTVAVNGVTGNVPGGNVTFTFTQGSVSDIITVSYLGNLQNYAAYLSSMAQNFFSTRYILYTISDAINTGGRAQLINGIVQIGSIGSLGFQAQNQVSVNARIWTWNFQNDRADLIFEETPITPSVGIVDSIQPVPAADIEAGVGFQVTYNIFFKKRLNLNDVNDKSKK
jgi:hypothetical protein